MAWWGDHATITHKALMVSMYGALIQDKDFNNMCKIGLQWTSIILQLVSTWQSLQ